MSAPLRGAGPSTWGLVALFLLVNGLVALNAAWHPPNVGYDAAEHLAYVQTLAEGRLPTPADSAEFFSPPLSYLMPAAVMSVTGIDVLAGGKVAQVLSILLSVAISWSLLRTCLLVSPSPWLRAGVLLCLGMLPVYYKTMAFVRPEPYVALFAVVGLQLALRVFVLEHAGREHSIGLGAALGLAILSRQWAVFLLPAVVVLAALVVKRSSGERRWGHVRALALALCVAFVAGGWFYLHLSVRHGSPTAFNRGGAPSFSLGNQPGEFYAGTGGRRLFTEPVRPAFPNQALPILYSETWGDYWCYFLVAGRSLHSGEWLSGSFFNHARRPDRLVRHVSSNRFRIAPYLGRVNLLALVPTGFLLVALGAGLGAVWRLTRGGEADGARAAAALSALVVGFSVAGYAWFLIQYPDLTSGSTIKASYLLHVFPCLALLGGLLLESVRAASARLHLFLVLSAIWLHAIPACITRFTDAGVGAS